MLNDQRPLHDDDLNSPTTKEIHALIPPSSSSSHRSSSSTFSADAGENFTTISREFNALVLAGSRVRTQNHSGPSNLRRIGEEHILNDETNRLAIVPDHNPLQSPRRDGAGGSSGNHTGGEVTVQQVKKEEAESRINAWQNAKIAKINNRFKREETIIHSWEDKKAHEASSWMKEVERKIEEKRAKAMEKMQNDIAKARRKAEETEASAEAKRGMKVARVMETANFMRAMGRPPAKRSFF